MASMTISVNIAEAKAQLSYLISRAKAGEEVIICNRNEPAVRFMPVEAKPKKKRVFGFMKGQFVVPPEFFEPMSEEELALWYDAPLVADPMPENE